MAWAVPAIVADIHHVSSTRSPRPFARPNVPDARVCFPSFVITKFSPVPPWWNTCAKHLNAVQHAEMASTNACLSGPPQAVACSAHIHSVDQR